MTAPKPTADDVAKAERLVAELAFFCIERGNDVMGSDISREVHRFAQAIATARAEGRAEGIREAACISPCYWDLELSLRRRLEADILALLDTPKGDDK